MKAPDQTGDFSVKPSRLLYGVRIGTILGSIPVYSYTWHKFFHILGVVVLVGNLVITGAWMAWAVNRKDARIVAFASSAVNVADLYFTASGSALIVLNGLAMAAAASWGGWLGFYRTGWITSGASLFLASALIWVIWLRRYQNQMVRISSEAAKTNSELPGQFQKVFQNWTVGGAIATILPLVALYLMVYKPI